MADFYDLLDRIKNRPGMYIGQASVSDLFMFLSGYRCSLREQGVQLSEQEREFHHFQPWLQKKFNVSTSASWAKMILLFTGDEQLGFKTFFELLEEFRHQSLSGMNGSGESQSSPNSVMIPQGKG
jgi:hypothetical protein